MSGRIVPPYIGERLRIIRRPCSVCQAKPMEPCTIPTPTGRKEVQWFHLDREFYPESQGGDCNEEGMEGAG